MLERGIRSERALLCALAEMYVQGVSTRKVSAIVEQLAGCEVTSMQVSRATAAPESNVPQGLAVFELPTEHRMRCRTVNGLGATE